MKPNVKYLIRGLLPDEKKNADIPERRNPVAGELLICFTLAIFAALCTYALVGLNFIKLEDGEIGKFIYSAGKEFTYSKPLLMYSPILGSISTVVMIGSMFIFKPSGVRPTIGKKGKDLISLIIFALFGILAYVVLALFMESLNLRVDFAVVIASLIVSVYDILIYKLEAEQRSKSNALFWELFRFAIVGLIAAVFDFALCFVVQFLCFKGNESNYVTAIATACGFTIGVIINYLMSTFMVYKAAKTNTGKTAKGVVIFFVLSVIGLFIGIGLQYLLYDYLFLVQKISFFSYPVDFVIRTLVVMIYNYVSRKLIIYR